MSTQPDTRHRLTLCLAHLPSRAALLPRVLASLQAQTRPPDQIIVSWCRSYRRLSGTFTEPQVPPGVTLFEAPDRGPLTKLFPLPHLTGTIVWCDDDAIYGPGWLDALVDGPRGTCRAASTFDIARLKRVGPGTVVQGFAGVAAPVSALRGVLDVTHADLWADDIWISGVLAANGAEILDRPLARAQVTPLAAPNPLQQDTDRAAANQAAADLVHARFDLWPRLAAKPD